MRARLPPSTPRVAARRITLERDYEARVEDVWELWTTKAGIESWWGPGGFRVEVHELALRVGGQLRYDMIATTPQTVAMMQAQWRADRHAARLTYREITPLRRLAYVHQADFIPDVAPYEVETVVELRPRGGTVHLVLTFDAMHDELWTERARMGWQSELGQLEAALDCTPSNQAGRT